MLQPKKTKFRREQKNVMKGMAQRGNQLAFGSFGLKTLENCWITAQQIESARQAISRCMNREGQIWIRISRSSLSPRSLSTPVWVRVRVILRDSSLL